MIEEVDHLRGIKSTKKFKKGDLAETLQKQ